MKPEVLFYQFFEPESCTYTYLIADKASKEAALIDPVLEMVDRDLQWIREAGLKLKYVLDTHIHADHITGAGQIRERLNIKTGVSRHAGVDCADLALKEGDELLLGEQKIKVLETPGHTNTCLTYQFADMIFTGDALLIRGTGRTDFQQGSSETLYDCIHQKIFTLPPETKVYPGHDYRGHLASTVGLEKAHNPRLGGDRTKADFVKIMSELKLAHPKKIQQALPANMACGQVPKNNMGGH